MKPKEQFHADVLIVSSILMEMLRSMDISSKRVGVAIIDGDEREIESLHDVLTRIKEHIGDAVLDGDDNSREATAKLLAKVGGAV